MTNPSKTDRSRELREQSTDSESLVWGLLRGRQVCNLKFRRQHPIGPYFADFACVAKRLIIELDGDYHDHVAEQDLKREAYLKANGWQIVRFSNSNVGADIESIGIAIANVIGVKYEFSKRSGLSSGMLKGTKKR